MSDSTLGPAAMRAARAVQAKAAELEDLLTTDHLAAIIDRETRCGEMERALRSLLLFHNGGPWERSVDDWYVLTGKRDATTRVLCEIIRNALGEDEETK